MVLLGIIADSAAILMCIRLKPKQKVLMLYTKPIDAQQPLLLRYIIEELPYRLLLDNFEPVVLMEHVKTPRVFSKRLSASDAF